MKRKKPELDDYTLENVSGATFFGSGLIILLIAMAVFFAIKQNSQVDRYYIHDTETVVTASRPPLNVYVRTELNYYLPGSILTSKANGALIFWDKTMPESWIVGIVSDSGTIEFDSLIIYPE